MAERDARLGQNPTVSDVLLGGLDQAAAAARGAFKTGLGLPGELYNLGRTVVGALPEHVRTYNPVARALNALPERTKYDIKWADNLLPPLGRASEYVPTTGALGAQDALQTMEDYGGGMLVGTRAGPLGMINKVRGAATAATRPMLPAVERVGRAVQGAVEGPLASYAVKPKAGNWYPDELDEYIGFLTGRFGPMGARPNPGVHGWGNRQLRNYVTNYLGTKDDPLLALEREGRLHLTPEDLAHRSDQFGLTSRRWLEDVPEGQAYYQLRSRTTARLRPEPASRADLYHIADTDRDYRTAWENLADNMVETRTAKDLLHRRYAHLGVNTESASPAGVRYDSAQELVNHVEAARTDPDHWLRLADAALKDDPELASMYKYLYPDEFPLQAMAGEMQNFATRNYDLAKRTLFMERDPTQQMHAYSGPVWEDHLGFDHVMDYLAGSGLTPQQLGRVSVPDAVAMAGEAQRRAAAEAAKLEKLRDANELKDSLRAMEGALLPYKQYPSGWRWVETNAYKHRDLPPGYTVGDAGAFHPHIKAPIYAVFDESGKPALDTHGSSVEAAQQRFRSKKMVEEGLVSQTPDGRFAVFDSSGQPMRGRPGTFSANERAVGDTPEEAATRAALISEGNYMAHCVGGYCDDVAGGEARILSLRDPEGLPRTTVELRNYSPTGEWDIRQIKGKRNQRPGDETQEYISDLLKSGKWGHVSDLHHTNIMDWTNTNFSIFSDSDQFRHWNAEALRRGIDALSKTQRFGTSEDLWKYMLRHHTTHDQLQRLARSPEELKEILDSLPQLPAPDTPAGFAAGGRVDFGALVGPAGLPNKDHYLKECGCA